MVLPIERDAQRYRRIIHGAVRKNLREYMVDSEIIGRHGQQTVSIPLPQIQLPHFRFGGKAKGVGQGDGDVGEPIFRDDEKGKGGKAGDQPGQHIVEAEFTIAELAEILGEELELPNILPKEANNIDGEAVRYTSLRRVGPESLKHFRTTFKEALKRQVASDAYDYANPVIVPVNEDKRYRSWKVYPKPNNNAVIFFMRDISSSMSQAKTQIVRCTSFWIDAWLQSQYKDVVRHYIVHEAQAGEVDQDLFYSLRVSGGTKISTGLRLCRDIIKRKYPVEMWNLYLFQFSDGENYENDNDECVSVLRDELLPILNLYCYGQIKYFGGYYALKGFITTLQQIEGFENMTHTLINEPAHVYDAIKTFLGKGK